MSKKTKSRPHDNVIPLNNDYTDFLDAIAEMQEAGLIEVDDDGNATLTKKGGEK